MARAKLPAGWRAQHGWGNPAWGGASMISLGIVMRISTATFLFVISAFSASIQRPAAAVVVSPAPGFPPAVWCEGPGLLPRLASVLLACRL
jgi:hypothetical protein